MFKMNIINKVYLIIDFFWFKCLSATYWRIFTFTLFRTLLARAFASSLAKESDAAAL